MNDIFVVSPTQSVGLTAEAIEVPLSIMKGELTNRDLLQTK